MIKIIYNKLIKSLSNKFYPEQSLNNTCLLYTSSKSVECNFFRNILEQQKEVAESLQDDLQEELKGYFFTYHKFQVKRYTGGEIKYFEKKEIMVACEYSIKHFIKNVCKRYNIRDEQGNLAHFSSHNLRHNGITDRLSPDGGFETGDVAAITLSLIHISKVKFL